MKTQSAGAKLAVHIAARIREFQDARGISADTLAQAANLSFEEVALLDTASEHMTTDMIDRIATVFGVHPAVLCLDPNEHAMAKFLEVERDLPRDEFQKHADELAWRGFFRSRGSA